MTNKRPSRKSIPAAKTIIASLAVAACLETAAETLPPLPEGAFTYVVIPDTQLYRGEGCKIRKGEPPQTGPVRNPSFDSRIGWIQRNVWKENIAFVSHVGDITDIHSEPQWAFASNQMARIDGLVPYGISPGNHDLEVCTCEGFNRYFPRSRYDGNSWYAGSFDGYVRASDGVRVSWGNANSCQTFDSGGMKFVVLHLECNAPAPVLKWADRMLEKFADRRAIVCTHMYQGYRTKKLFIERKKRTNRETSSFGVMDWTKCHKEDGVSAEKAWQTCFSKHPNLILIVSGDQGPAICWRETQIGENGNTVHAVMQDYPRSGDEQDWLRLFRFRPREGRIDVFTYSPSQDALCEEAGFRKGRDWHQFSLAIEPSSTAPQEENTPSVAEYLQMPRLERVKWFENGAFRRKMLSAGYTNGPGLLSRWVEVEKIPNFRDVGGINTMDGRELRRGVLYRSAGWNDNAITFIGASHSEWRPGKTRLTEKGRSQLAKLGIKTDLDLRTPEECWGMHGSPLGDAVRWINISSGSYARFDKMEWTRKAVKDCFEVLSDSSRLPLVFHCIGGADRTGCLAYMIQVLCGVDEETALKDWELTGAYTARPTFTHKKMMDYFLGCLETFPGDTAEKRMRSFLSHCGVPESQMESLRQTMLPEH